MNMERLIDVDALLNTLQELFDKREKEQMFTGSRGACVTWNDAIYQIKSAPTVDAVPWMWLEVFAKTRPFDSVEVFITEAKEMNCKMYSCCCADGERKE